MTRYRPHALKSRLRRNQRQTVRTQLNSLAPANRGVLENIGQVAQIALAVVAIFGYFYTVRPTYQKEQLAEQVAEYDSIIKKQTPKIAEIEARLAELQTERAGLEKEIQKDRVRLTNELQNVERQLASARTEKDRIEAQIQFMTFRYRLPDGTPAVTGEQVKVAQAYELKKSYLSSIYLGCAFNSGAFLKFSYEKYDKKNKSWPFNDKELSAWKEYGTKYPLIAAMECINSASIKFAEQYGKGHADEIEGLRKQVIQYANRAAEKEWVSPVQPEQLIQELATKRSSSEATMKLDLKKIEDEYGDWESTFGDARRAIFKHNYEVGKKNAEMLAYNRSVSVEYEAQQRANDMRKSIHDEIQRLIITNVKGETKPSQ